MLWRNLLDEKCKHGLKWSRSSPVKYSYASHRGKERLCKEKKSLGPIFPNGRASHRDMNIRCPPPPFPPNMTLLEPG